MDSSTVSFDGATRWLSDSIPLWERNETNKRLRWYWVDRNGDGIPQKSEFGTYDNYNMYNQGLDVDENGDIWTGGQGSVDTYFRSGGLMRITVGSLDANGVPQFHVDALNRYDIPDSEIVRVKHIAAGDVMYMAIGANAWDSKAILRYDNFTDSTKRIQRYRIDLGFNDNGDSTIQLDINTATMTIPFTFTADTNFVYVTYLDKGRDARVRGEVTVYDAHDGHEVGWLAPDSGTGYFSGAADLVNALNATTQTDGHEIVMVEEDGAGKVMVYRWCPDGTACSTLTHLKNTSPHAIIHEQSIKAYNLLGQRMPK